jgi:hypothetical protein
MKIKNIQQYRTYYKEKVRYDSHKDENFIGTTYREPDTREKKFGWFDIYHGDKEGYGRTEEGISNFLQSFLDMAKDGQAVYEFLQNAVDAGSSHFTMIWGEDEVDGNKYVLVANNGEMFDFNSVRSILNVGSSTKNSNSQNIGKFGIGFKLAHRLVGKDNGLDELINQNSGPVLFSWKNNELQQLGNSETIEPSDIEIIEESEDKHVIQDTNPWLFKILITCFPCLPENDIVNERIKLIGGTEINEPTFKKEEYDVLARWVKEYSDILSPDIYNEGSLFFIKLGKGKEADLADKNLAEGVKFSMAILHETAEDKEKKNTILKTVQLNRENKITLPELHYLFFNISKKDNLSDYLYVRFGIENKEELTQEQKNKVESEADIEVLFGFRQYEKIGDFFKGAPNLYLYFPLSEEVHNFNFILHSNAFYKASSRTFLHKGTAGEDGINERLLRKISERTGSELKRLFDSSDLKDNNDFLNLYAALLTSKESQNQDRQWIQEPFINELNKVLKKYIPVKNSSLDKGFSIENNNQLVYIKRTGIDVESWGLTDTKWFYWSKESNDELWLSATKKLGVKSFDIINLLSIPNIHSQVNNWLNGNSTRITQVLKELDFFDKTRITPTVTDNLLNLKLIEFSDNNTLSLKELDEKQSNGYFILHNKLSEIKDLLLKCSFKVTKLDFNDFSFVDNYRSYLSDKSQLKGHKNLVEIFSSNITQERASRLTKDNKLSIFRAFRDLNKEDRTSRIKQLKLFRNKCGELSYTKNILKESSSNWLQDYVIHPDDFHMDINAYLLSDTKEYYEYIIYPNWERIAKQIAQTDELNKKSILESVESLFKEYKFNTNKDLLLLGKYNKWFSNSEYIECKNIYFNDNLKPYNSAKYIELQKALLKFIDVQLPDQYFLDYCDSEVFGFSPSKIQFNFKEKIISTREIKTLAEFSILGSYGIFNTNLINVKEDGSFEILNEEGKTMYYSSSTLINAYIQSYHKSSLHPLPLNLADIKDAIDNRGEKLYSQLIDQLLVDNETQVLGLINALQAKTEVHHILFSKIPEFEFDCSWVNEELNKTYVGFIKSLLSNDNIEVKSIYSKVVFNSNNHLIYLKDIDQANDSIKLTRDDKTITISRTNLLLLKGDSGIKAIQDFANRCVQSELITSKESDKLFKLTDSGITDELFAKFNETIEKHQLINVDQILFVVLSGKVEETQIKTYKILTQKDEWQSLEGNWLFPTEHAIEIFDANYMLHNNYSGIQELLQLNDLETFIYGEKSNEGEYGMDSFFSDFLFQKACSSAIFVENGKPLGILKHLYQSWKKTRTDNRISKENEDWKTSLGFSPKLKVVGDLIVEDEYVGEEISSWIQEDLSSKTEFLKSIGFNITNSHIIQLRDSIINQEQINTAIKITNIETELLTNTLLGIADGFSTNSSALHFTINDTTHQQIEKIVLHLIDNDATNEVRLPHYLSSSQLALLGKEITEPFYLNPEIHQLLIDGLNNDALDTLYSHVPIVYFTEELQDYIEKNYSEFELNSSFIVSTEVQEHSEPFYNKWFEEKNIKLFRCDNINYKIIAAHEESEIELGIISKGHYHITSNEDFISVYYHRNISLEALSEEIKNNESGNENVSSQLQELITERNRTLAAFYNAMTISGRDDFDSEIANSFMNTLKQKNIEDEREAFITTLGEEQKYSYNWFVTYLKYLLSFEQIAETTAQKSITFQKIKPFQIDDKVSDKYFLLEGANNLIPVNIEAFENFSISLVFKSHAKEKVTVEGVSKKGQDLLVYCPKGIDQKIKSNFSNVVNIKINFIPVLDLLQRLYNAFINDNYITEWDDILEATQTVTFLYGPPGTGKTTTISNKIITEHASNPVLKCLVLTPTNKAGDVLAKKILDNSNSVSIIRLGNATSPELEAIDEEIYQNDLNDLKLDGANVIISSIHRLPYYQVNKADGGAIKLFDSEISWDYVIFDEASMINLPYQVFALMAFKQSCPDAKIIIAGDPKQIPPVVDASDKEIENLDIEDENIYKMFGINNISTVEEDKRAIDIVEKLTTQYRSVQEIGQIFSEFSYQNVLNHHRHNGCSRKALPESFLQSLNSPVSFIDIPIDIDNSVTEPRKLLYSSYHVHAGILASELIKYLDNCIKDDSHYNIGIISPYKAQALLVNKLITSMDISSNLNVHCDTVHGFQGDECDIIIFIVNPNNTFYSGHRKSLLSKEYIYNVAISRAQDYLWIMNPYQTIKNNPHINGISNIHKGNGGNTSIISSYEIEKTIFNDDNFIVKNSYLTGHDSINVFGSVEMKYFIKASETAIDIQILSKN